MRLRQTSRFGSVVVKHQCFIADTPKVYDVSVDRYGNVFESVIDQPKGRCRLWFSALQRWQSYDLKGKLLTAQSS